jgi:hypothetical protein
MLYVACFIFWHLFTGVYQITVVNEAVGKTFRHILAILLTKRISFLSCSPLMRARMRCWILVSIYVSVRNSSWRE